MTYPINCVHSNCNVRTIKMKYQRLADEHRTTGNHTISKATYMVKEIKLAIGQYIF